MTAAPLTGLLTAADLSHEPEDGHGRELHDGVVYVVPPPSNTHAQEAGAADRALYRHAPDDVVVLQGVGIHTGLRRLYVPDVLVVHADTPFHDNGYDPGGVQLVVEVVSPSSVTMDRITKPTVYGQLGIPHLWRIETDADGPRLEVHVLDPQTEKYEQVREFGPDDGGSLTDPWPIEIDMARFALPRRP